MSRLGKYGACRQKAKIKNQSRKQRAIEIGEMQQQYIQELCRSQARPLVGSLPCPLSSKDLRITSAPSVHNHKGLYNGL